jgi:uncharacterized protein with GYD domain
MRLIHTQSNFSARAEDVFWTLGKYDIVAVVEARGGHIEGLSRAELGREIN